MKEAQEQARAESAEQPTDPARMEAEAARCRKLSERTEEQHEKDADEADSAFEQACDDAREAVEEAVGADKHGSAKDKVAYGMIDRLWEDVDMVKMVIAEGIMKVVTMLKDFVVQLATDTWNTLKSIAGDVWESAKKAATGDMVEIGKWAMGSILLLITGGAGALRRMVFGKPRGGAVDAPKGSAEDVATEVVAAEAAKQTAEEMAETAAEETAKSADDAAVEAAKATTEEVADTADDAAAQAGTQSAEVVNDNAPTLAPGEVTNEAFAELAQELDGLSAAEAQKRFDELYPSEIKGREFKQLGTTPQGEILALDQDGIFRVFRDGTEFAYVRNLNEVTPQQPLLTGWKWPDTAELDVRRVDFQEGLAREFDVPEGQRADWIRANTDEMTGLMNRSIYRVAEQWILEGRQFSVASFDADHFGALNKLKGMDYGDHLIAIMGDEFQTLKRNLEARGFEAHVGRMGGEEFAPLTTAPSQILHAEMELLNNRLQRRIQETLQPEERVLLQDLLHEVKDVDHAISVNEIGTATSATVNFNFGGVSAVDAMQSAQATAHMADGLLESGKNTVDRFPAGKGSGRNWQYLDTHSGSNNTERLVGRAEVPKENLSDIQHANMEHLSTEILTAKAAARMAEMPAVQKLEDAMQAAGLTVREQQLIHHVIASPAGLNDLAPKLRGEIDAALARHADLPDQLAAARQGAMRFAADHEPSLNTLNPRAYLKAADLPQFRGGAELTVDPLQFKAINETLGHGFADRLLEQNVLELRALFAERGIDVAISKDLSKLQIRLPNTLSPADVADVQRAIATRYEAMFRELVGSAETPGRLDVDNVDTATAHEQLIEWQRLKQTGQKIREEPLGTVAVTLREAA